MCTSRGLDYIRGDLSVWSACPENGIKFRRVDISANGTVIAHASYAEQARLCTRIVNSDGITSNYRTFDGDIRRCGTR